MALTSLTTTTMHAAVLRVVSGKEPAAPAAPTIQIRQAAPAPKKGCC